jgi:hypothetical protein
MCLDVQGGSKAVGGAVRQAAADGTSAQDFAFEDAGDGFVYIRSNVSGLYVTVDVAREPVMADPTLVAGPPPGPTPSGPGGAQLPAHLPDLLLVGPPIADGASSVAPTGPGLIQDVKYKPLGPLGSIAVGRPNPAYQRWRLTPASPVAFERDLFVISCDAFPGKVLQAADPAQAGSAVVLGDPGGVAGVLVVKHAWKVSTRLISDTPVMTTH